ncbi:hypothetical protein NMG60_11030946 [Bertholletia excelsa]
MDPTKAEKLRAMKSYKKSQLFNGLILHSSTALVCTLLSSYLFPLPWYSFKHLVFSSLPNLNKSSFISPSCLLILGNAIVIFLIAESKLSGSKNPSPVMEIYDEYDERTRRIREVSTLPRKNEAQELEKIEYECVVKEKEEVELEDVDGGNNEIGKEEKGEKEEIEERGKEKEEEEETGLKEKEFNKRVEDFIARVKRQRWVEARLIDCGRG